MVTRYAVYLDGQGLADIDPSIYVTDIAYAQPDLLLNTADKPTRAGQIVTRRNVQRSVVSISFEVHEYDTARRQDIIRRIQAWAMRGGMLTTGDRPGQRLRVVCTAPPAITSALRWTQRLQMTFSAFSQPYWEDVQETRTTITGKEGAKTIYVAGVSPAAYVSAEVTNSSGQTISSLTLRAGDTHFTFENLVFYSGMQLKVGYDDQMNLFIRLASASRMQFRTPESSDDLLIPCGKRSEVSIVSDQPVTATFKARGLYL